MINYFDVYGLLALDSVTTAIQACLKSAPPAAITCLEQLLTTVAEDAQANLIRNALDALKSRMMRCARMYAGISPLCKTPGCGDDGLSPAEYVRRAGFATACAGVRAQWLRECACKGLMDGIGGAAFWETHWLEVGKAVAKATNCWHKAKKAGWGGNVPEVNP